MLTVRKGQLDRILLSQTWKHRSLGLLPPAASASATKVGALGAFPTLALWAPLRKLRLLLRAVVRLWPRVGHQAEARAQGETTREFTDTVVVIFLGADCLLFGSSAWLAHGHRRLRSIFEQHLNKTTTAIICLSFI